MSHEKFLPKGIERHWYSVDRAIRYINALDADPNKPFGVFDEKVIGHQVGNTVTEEVVYEVKDGYTIIDNSKILHKLKINLLNVIRKELVEVDDEGIVFDIEKEGGFKIDRNG